MNSFNESERTILFSFMDGFRIIRIMSTSSRLHTISWNLPKIQFREAAQFSSFLKLFSNWAVPKRLAGRRKKFQKCLIQPQREAIIYQLVQFYSTHIVYSYSSIFGPTVPNNIPNRVQNYHFPPNGLDLSFFASSVAFKFVVTQPICHLLKFH